VYKELLKENYRCHRLWIQIYSFKFKYFSSPGVKQAKYRLLHIPGMSIGDKSIKLSELKKNI